MDKFELMKQTLRWVTGYCWEWNSHAKQFSFDEARGLRPSFDDFVHRTHAVVWRYLHGQQTLDGSCSDMECVIAIEAKSVFRDLIQKEDRNGN